jgi:phospholipid/cholesterol/gamma-HCH transport system ATP-binding protein
MNNLVEVRQLHFVRGKKVIFNHIDLDIPEGKITAIMGPSGTGKTTLLRLIGGQIAPQNGIITLSGQNVHGMSREGLFTLRTKMGMLFQSGG